MIKLILSIIIQINLNYYNTPTKLLVHEEIVKQEILFPSIVYAQAGAETSWGTTGVGKTRNNLFGFRVTEYINFNDSTDTWKASIRYYKDWQQKYFTKHLKEHPKCDYYHFLKSIGYKTGKPYHIKEDSYIAYLKRINNPYENR